MHWKKILLVGGILMVAFVAGLCVQKPEGIEPTPLQPAEELKLSDFPEAAFKDSTLIVVGDNASEIEMQAVNEIADYLENETGNKPLIKKHSEISDEDKRSYNLIVVGTPKTNPFLEEVYAMTNATRVTEEFPGEGKGVLEILRNPWDEEKAMLLVEGWDERGIDSGIITLQKEKISGRIFITQNFGEKVVIFTDRSEYKKKVEVKNNYIYGEIIYITIKNNLNKKIHFDKSLTIPFTSVYIECLSDGNWQLCKDLHSIAKLPFNYTSINWLETATRLEPGEKIIFEYKIIYRKDWNPYSGEKYRFKLEYCYNLTGKDDWLMREEITPREIIKEKKFEAVYSNEFTIR